MSTAAHARLIGLGLDTRPFIRCHLRVDLLVGITRVGNPRRRVVVVGVGGDDLRLVCRLVARALQVGGDLLVCFVVVPQLGVDVRGRGRANLVSACAVGQVDAGGGAGLGRRFVDESGQAVGQVHGVAGCILLDGLSERVDVRAVEPEGVLLGHVLIRDVVAPPLGVDVHHELVTLRLVHALGGRHPPLLAEVANPVGSVVLTQTPLVLDSVRVVVVVSRVCHRVGE